MFSQHGQLLVESVFLGHNAEALLDCDGPDRGIVTKDFEVSTGCGCT